MTSRFSNADGMINLLNCKDISHCLGNLPNLTKTEFARLMLEYAPGVRDLNHGEFLVIHLPDGRLLSYCCSIFPETETQPELREWSVQLYTLNQKKSGGAKHFRNRKAWLYLAPYESEGYKTDPTKTWSYRVWA